MVSVRIWVETMLASPACAGGIVPLMVNGRLSAVPMLEAVAAVPATTTPGVAVMLYSRPAITPAPTPLVAVAAAVASTAKVSKAAVIPDPNKPLVQDKVAITGEAVWVPT